MFIKRHDYLSNRTSPKYGKICAYKNVKLFPVINTLQIRLADSFKMVSNFSAQILLMIVRLKCG